MPSSLPISARVGGRLKRPEALRVCSPCYREQVERDAEPCWQRLFQVTGVHVCPEPRVLLQDTGVPYVPFNKHQFWAVPRSLPESKDQLPVHSPALYMPLYRQDRKWLLENSPQKEQREKTGRRIDWERRDKTTARKVIVAGKKYRENPPLRRLSRRLLASAAGWLAALDKRVEPLPITEQASRKYGDSPPEFRRRRIDGVVAALRRNG